MKPCLPAAAAVALFAASCTPPPAVPPPRYVPPAYGQEPQAEVDPYGEQRFEPQGPEGQAVPPTQGPTAPTTGQPPTMGQPMPRPGEYPVARRTANPNEVISPYPPYNVIDVQGFRSGQLARDPSNKQIFRVP